MPRMMSLDPERVRAAVAYVLLPRSASAAVEYFITDPGRKTLVSFAFALGSAIAFDGAVHESLEALR
jgi:hypothetical protein